MKILVADDHPIMRLGIRQLITREWPEAEVVEAETIEAALQRFEETRPDLVVLDLVMPDVAGTEGVARMLRVTGSAPILVLSFNSESTFASRLLRMGVCGYLPKDRATEELIVAMKRLLEGKRYVTASMADHLVDSLSGRGRAGELHEQLSSQEHRVMLLIAAGKAPAEIAKTMQLSVKTVGTYRARIFEKAGWTSNAELTRYCVHQGLAEDS